MPEPFDRERSYTTDNTTRAGVPGRVQVNWNRWARAYPRPLLFLGAVLLITLIVFALTRQVMVLVFGLVCLSGLWKQISLRVREHFHFGCANPAVVLSVAPPRLAVYTDLATGPRTPYKVIKVIAPPLHLFAGGTPEMGAKTVTVSLYERGDDTEQTGHWSDFHPVPVALVVAEKSESDATQARVPQKWWDLLEEGVRALPPHITVNTLYPFQPEPRQSKDNL